MLDHLTSVPDVPPAVTAIVLVGPPATGKSTVRNMFSDYGVAGCDLDDYHNTGRVVDDDWAGVVIETINEADNSEPRVCCIEGPIEEKQVGFVREHTDSTLVIKIDATDRGDYVERYVERELASLSANDDGMISESDITSLKTNVSRQHQVEAPYPDHDVAITNSDELSTNDLSRRCGRIVQSVSNCEQLNVHQA